MRGDTVRGADDRRPGYAGRLHPLRQRVTYVTFLKASEAQRAKRWLQVKTNVQIVGQIGFERDDGALLLEPAVKVLRDGLLLVAH